MSTLRIRLASLSAALVVATASAAAAQQSSTTPVPPPASPAAGAAAPGETRAEPEKRESRGRRRANRDRLDLEEIQANQATLYDAYSLVTSLRPTWLTVRRGSMMLTEGVRVYRDGVGMGGINALRQIPSNSVERIEHLDDGQATMRFGTGHGSGAILVFTRL